MTIEIRPIRLEDAEGYNRVLDLVAREEVYLRLIKAPPLPASLDFVRNNIARDNSHFVALDQGEVIGWCDVCRSDERGSEHVGSLGMGLAPSHRGQGIGRRLIDATMEHAATRFRRVELDVYESNHRAQALYRAASFEHEGTRRAAILLKNGYQDILTMARIFEI